MSLKCRQEALIRCHYVNIKTNLAINLQLIALIVDQLVNVMK